MYDTDQEEVFVKQNTKRQGKTRKKESYSEDGLRKKPINTGKKASRQKRQTLLDEAFDLMTGFLD